MFNTKDAIDCHRNGVSSTIITIGIILIAFLFLSKANNEPHSKEVIEKYEQQKQESKRSEQQPHDNTILYLLIGGSILMAVIRK